MTRLSTDPGAGFTDPVLASQSVFRGVMNALARPGTIQILPTHVAVAGPGAMSPGVAALVLALADHDTPVWFDPALAADKEAANWLRFHTGAPLVEHKTQCVFALIGDGRSMPPLEQFALGSDEYPDRSATLIVQVDTLTEGPPLVLSGPGIRGTTVCRAGGLPANIAEQLAANRTLFPRGIDLVLVRGTQLISIPRSTRVVTQGA